MKICTITCHEVYNHGASLQAYALMKFLSNNGHNVEIIDYKPYYLNNHYNFFKIENSKWEKNQIVKILYIILKLPFRIIDLKRKRAFDKFSSKYLVKTKFRYSTNEQLKKNTPIADVYICGSDQIWNTLFPNGRDPAFYLDFAPEFSIKASYAASIATERIQEEYKEFIKEKVSNLNRISVREKSGKKLLEELDVENVKDVVDPTLLLNKSEWNALSNKNFNEEYILIYDFDENELIREIAIKLSELKQIKIYSITSKKFNYVDKNFKYIGPETFISLIKGATYILTNSFHATVFSVIYRKNFFVFNRRESINTRMIDFLDELKLNHRLITNNYIFENILKGINYEDINSILIEKINNSKLFLNNLLKNEVDSKFV